MAQLLMGIGGFLASELPSILGSLISNAVAIARQVLEYLVAFARRLIEYMGENPLAALLILANLIIWMS